MFPRKPTALPFVIAVAIAGTGCTTVDNEPVPSPTGSLSEPYFKCAVEPVLIKQCSYNACHGNKDSALRVYSIGKLRAKTPQNLDDFNNPLTDEEHHGNYTNAAGFALGVTDPTQNWLLLKPLPPSLGGYEHKGGAIYNGTADAQFGAIYAWLKGASTCP